MVKYTLLPIATSSEKKGKKNKKASVGPPSPSLPTLLERDKAIMTGKAPFAALCKEIALIGLAGRL